MMWLYPVLFFGIVIGTLFGSAGRWDLPWFWVCVAFYVAVWLVALPGMDPELRRRRLSLGPGPRGQQIRKLLAPFALTRWVVAGLDVGRFEWSGPVPLGVHLAGLVIGLLGMGFVLWSIRVNRFFEPAVRIQTERGHHVITTGPYHFLRHPGYAGMAWTAVGESLLLGSWWTLVPTAGLIVVIILHTAFEDRFLRRELEGYADYAQKVRYRLVPAVW